ncbi:hypothetical protein BD779DRAFT_1797449 [Infundibulicybe gibba]|nr:hypothetical protein BD779DRAFT_1797449 [Infundibulicybe gibba]
MVPKRFRDIILPLVIFPFLTMLAVKYTHVHMFKSGAMHKLTTQCAVPLESPGAPYRLRYSGYDAIDAQLCGVVAFFHAIMTPTEPLAFLSYFLGTAAALTVIPAIEAARKGRGAFLAFPIITGILCQTLTVGATMPLFGCSSSSRAIVFGLFLGLIIPSACLVIMGDPIAIHLFFRSEKNHPQSGFETIRVMYIGIFIVASSVHISTVWTKLGDLESLKLIFIPSLSILNPSTSLEFQALDFLKWDGIFGFGSSVVGTLWFANTAAELFGLVLWHAIAIPLVGPGAALAASALWRESHLSIPAIAHTKKTQ